MNYDDFFNNIQESNYIEAGSDFHLIMHELSEHAQRVTMKLNSQVNTQDEITKLLSELTGSEVENFSTLLF